MKGWECEEFVGRSRVLSVVIWSPCPALMELFLRRNWWSGERCVGARKTRTTQFDEFYTQPTKLVS